MKRQTQMNKPTALPVQFENIPISLKKISRWVLWRLVEVGEGSSKRWSKLPLQSNGSSASSTNPTTWCDFLHAQEAYQTGRFDGVGFVFDGSDGIMGIDLDDCVDAVQGPTSLTPEAQAIKDAVLGYAEVSPSGTGIKIFTRAQLNAAHVDHEKGLEIYPQGPLLHGDRPHARRHHSRSGAGPTTHRARTQKLPFRRRVCGLQPTTRRVGLGPC